MRLCQITGFFHWDDYHLPLCSDKAGNGEMWQKVLAPTGPSQISSLLLRLLNKDSAGTDPVTKPNQFLQSSFIKSQLFPSILFSGLGSITVLLCLPPAEHPAKDLLPFLPAVRSSRARLTSVAPGIPVVFLSSVPGPLGMGWSVSSRICPAGLIYQHIRFHGV